MADVNITSIKPKMGRPRKYFNEDEIKSKNKETSLKYNKEHAELLRQQNKDYYIRKNYIEKQTKTKYNTTYSQMYGVNQTGISI